MAAADSTNQIEAHPMSGGSGPNSYTKNSKLQKGAIDLTKEIVRESIADYFDIKCLSSPTLQLADLGCSVGPNTFFAVQNIVDAIEVKCRSHGHNSHIPEFQVFFCDHASNDFNTLFTSLPPERAYHAMGVPGSFYGRLFPNSCLHFVHSSYAIHWLSRVPKEVTDRSSPAWNKGRITYCDAPKEVVEAYEAQRAKDLETFLQSRAEEMVGGGLMALVFPGRPSGTPHPRVLINRVWSLLESALLDMTKKGALSEELVDSFNIPIYMMSPQELEAAVQRNGCFSIERMEGLPQEIAEPKVAASTIRAVTEPIIREHFGVGDETVDEIFDLFKSKNEGFPFHELKAMNVFALLKRKESN